MQRILAAISMTGIAAALAVCCGCLGGPKRISPPAWNPDRSARQAMELYDTNKDGQLDQGELAEAPALKGALRELDANNDQQISEQEIVDRIAGYKELGMGMTPCVGSITYKGRPLANATVVLKPAPFLDDIIEAASGTTNDQGECFFRAEGAPVAAVRYGLYSIEVTSSSEELPVHFNVDTELGVEIAADLPRANGGAVVLKL